jgi:apolipoprotein N-acyltransferase
MTRPAKYSIALSVLACLLFGTVVCCTVGWLPMAAHPPLAFTAIATSAIAGLVGLVVAFRSDHQKRSVESVIVFGLALVASLPAIAVVNALLLPHD